MSSGAEPTRANSVKPAAARAQPAGTVSAAPSAVGGTGPGGGAPARVPFHRAAYGPLALLHASLILRLIGGDAAGSTVAWQTGGVLNEAAILAFLATMATTAMRARNGRAGRG